MVENVHMNEEKDFKPERVKTAKITGLDEKVILKLLEEFTHSEIRNWKFEWTKFIPWGFYEMILKKKDNRNCKILFNS